MERVAVAKIETAQFKMDVLANLSDFAQAKATLDPIVAEYRIWISKQTVPDLSAKRQATTDNLQAKASVAANRIAQGIALLEDPQCLAAFKLANHAMAVSGRRRLGTMVAIRRNR